LSVGNAAIAIPRIGVAPRDLSEQAGVVDDRREKIDGLRERTGPIDLQNRRVVVRRVAYQKIRPCEWGKFRQDCSQVILTQLARSTTGGGERRQRGV
jgi:hypothetical protein